LLARTLRAMLAAHAGCEETLSAMQHDNVAVRLAAHLHVNEPTRSLSGEYLSPLTIPDIWDQPSSV